MSEFVGYCVIKAGRESYGTAVCLGVFEKEKDANERCEAERATCDASEFVNIHVISHETRVNL